MHLHVTIIHKFQATSAFDGTRTFKWEEPNGAKGIKFQLKIEPPCCLITIINRNKATIGSK